MENAQERLKTARVRAGFETAADAAEYLGIATPTYTSHENGSRGITANKAAIYARAFKVSPEWLLYGRAGAAQRRQETSIPNPEPVAMVPVYDVQASAGDGATVIHEEPVSSLVFPARYLSHITSSNPRDLSIISVKGDSMHPTLADDDVVMLDRSKRDLSFDGLFVIRDNGGDALLVKRIGRASAPGHVMVISDNRALYDPIEKKLEDIEVIGKVIWAGGKV
jgi:phage repressor protein C with HTH and peptisase S24 domain